MSTIKNGIRPRNVTNQNEEAGAELHLGDEFQNAHSLSLPEARIFINAVLENRNKAGRKVNETETHIKMQDYLETFSRFKEQEIVVAVEAILQPYQLQNFEKSQLINLCCDTAEEAKTLIPSLADKISDTDLHEILQEITKRRTFAE